MTLWPYPTTACGESRLIWKSQAASRTPNEVLDFWESAVNMIEGFWSLLRSWLRPHKGVSQEKLPLYLGLFEFGHNVRKRGKALLGAMIELLVTPTPRNAG
jgi:hypothetical protein